MTLNKALTTIVTMVPHHGAYRKYRVEKLEMI